MWMTSFPTKPGWYWFYGNQFKGADLKLTTVQVWFNGIAVVCEGAFMYEQELGTVRWFQFLEPPSISGLEGKDVE